MTEKKLNTVYAVLPIAALQTTGYISKHPPLKNLFLKQEHPGKGDHRQQPHILHLQEKNKILQCYEKLFEGVNSASDHHAKPPLMSGKIYEKLNWYSLIPVDSLSIEHKEDVCYLRLS